jgi:two-component system sensor histidine kinase DesK
VQAAIVYVPILFFQTKWLGQPGFFAGSVLLALPPRVGWVAFSLVALSAAVIRQQFPTYSPRVLDFVYTIVATAITGLVTYGLTRMASMVIDLERARGELAALAVAQERLRIARDLHDLLGYSLSAITLKSELARRLLPTDV